MRNRGAVLQSHVDVYYAWIWGKQNGAHAAKPYIFKEEKGKEFPVW